MDLSASQRVMVREYTLGTTGSFALDLVADLTAVIRSSLIDQNKVPRGVSSAVTFCGVFLPTAPFHDRESSARKDRLADSEL